MLQLTNAIANPWYTIACHVTVGISPLLGALYMRPILGDCITKLYNKT
jgi:hypothetical protein